MMGDAKYQEKMVWLMNQMPGMRETEMAVDLSQSQNKDDDNIKSVLSSD